MWASGLWLRNKSQSSMWGAERGCRACACPAHGDICACYWGELRIEYALRYSCSLPYTAGIGEPDRFGKVVQGQGVVNKIKAVSTGRKGMFDDVPLEPVKISKAEILAGQQK